MMRALAILILLACRAVLADEGEIDVSAGAGVDAAALRHPLAAPSIFIDSQTAFAMLPRIMIRSGYGLTNDVTLAIGVDAGGTANIVTNGLVVGGVTSQIVTGGYFESSVPLSLAWRLDSGGDISGFARLEVGPMIAVWSASAAADPTKLDDGGRPARLLVDVADELGLGFEARVSVGLEIRLFDTIRLSLRPYVGAAWAATPSLRLGFVLEPALSFSPLPP